MDDHCTYTAFAGVRLLVSGPLEEMLRRTKEEVDRGAGERILIFEDQTGRAVDFDFQGTPADVLAKALPAKPKVGPGRPKLGVVCREVSLLPRHWDWLEHQPQGISAALRRLVDEARKREPNKERGRIAREAASKFMWGMAGDLPSFEEASRALYAKEHARFEELIRDWPQDIRLHLTRLVRESVHLETSAPEVSAEVAGPAAEG